MADVKHTPRLVTGDSGDTRKVVFAGQMYCGIRELGFTDDGYFVASFYTTPPPLPRGGFFTAIPISPADYRAKTPTKCGFVVGQGQLIVLDDWGNATRITAEPSVIYALIENVRAHDLPDHSAIAKATGAARATEGGV